MSCVLSVALATNIDLRCLDEHRYLQSALKRINSLISGYQFQLSDIYAMQNMCAYEVCDSLQLQNLSSS